MKIVVDLLLEEAMIFDITTSNKTTIKTENLELNTVYDKRNYSLDTTADPNVTQPMTMYDN
jgi:hypothetical protein